MLRGMRLFKIVRNFLLDFLPPIVSRQIARYIMPCLGLAEHQQTLEAADTSSIVRKVETIAELDEWIARADWASQESDDALRRVLRSFQYVLDVEVPTDPFSEEYRTMQMALYTQISGRAQYYSLDQERTPFDFEAAVQMPFPYATKSSTTVGEQLILQGMLIRQLDLKPGARVVEFGPGWGNLTLELAKMGMRVTAVDVYPKFGHLISERARQLGLEIDVVIADMLDYHPKEPLDAAVFFDSFHHCSDHQRMLEKLGSIVTNQGILAFGAEPIAILPYPWGIRLDGMAIWSIRKFGWLENGFTESYFLEALRHAGWEPTITYGKDVMSSVVIAKRRGWAT